MVHEQQLASNFLRSGLHDLTNGPQWFSEIWCTRVFTVLDSDLLLPLLKQTWDPNSAWDHDPTPMSIYLRDVPLTEINKKSWCLGSVTETWLWGKLSTSKWSWNDAISCANETNLLPRSLIVLRLSKSRTIRELISCTRRVPGLLQPWETLHSQGAECDV